MSYTKALFVLSALLVCQIEVLACSVYKITLDKKTMVGCNHDAWLTTSKIWFENAKQENEYGAAFTGAREVQEGKTTPQSGMNTAGLVFSRLTSYYPKQNNPFTNKLEITSEADYLSDILHKCASIEDVRKYIEQFDHSFFMNDVFIYVESSGDYLIVEPYKLIEGNNPNYVLANFCPSITDTKQARTLDRYRNGEDFLRTNKTIPSLAFCTALSDTMHVCRSRNGDGTLLTSIWNAKDKVVNLYFYHKYDSTVQFSLVDELKKGDHSLAVPNLFPPNSEFERLVNYKTPSNTVGLRMILLGLAGLLGLLSFGICISLFWKKKYTMISGRAALLISMLNVILIAYIFILLKNSNIFYFDAPYKDYNSSVISLLSYTPFLLLLLFVPAISYTFTILRKDAAILWIKALLVSNSLSYLILIIGFAYWGLFLFWK